jgi:hypothetical protein
LPRAFSRKEIQMDAVTAIAAACEHCGTEFYPRHTGGGSPQRYCSTRCRKASHKSSQRPQRPTSVPASHETRLNDETLADTTSPDDLLLPAQSAITVARDEYGHLILRQLNWPDADGVIVINPEYEDDFVVRLTDFLGYARMP